MEKSNQLCVVARLVGAMMRSQPKQLLRANLVYMLHESVSMSNAHIITRESRHVPGQGSLQGSW